MQDNIDNYVKMVFKKMNKFNTGKISYLMFNEIMKKEPNILEIIDVLNEGFTYDVDHRKTTKTFETLYEKKLDHTIKKIEASMIELEKVLLNIEFKENPQKNFEISIMKNREIGPEFLGSRPKAIKFNEEEQSFGLEKENQLEDENRSHDLTLLKKKSRDGWI